MELLSESISHAASPVTGHRPARPAAAADRKAMRRQPVKRFLAARLSPTPFGMTAA